MLDKPTGALESGELAAVTELYIVADGAVGDKDAFYAAYNEWNTHGHSSEASVSTLSDMTLFPNLTTLCIVSGEYTDLSSLESCRAMTHVELYNNYKLTDISALVSLYELNYVGAIACPNVEDVTPLVGLPKLKNLDLSGRDQAFDAAPVARMGDFDLLLLKGVEDAHRYLGGKNICHLRLSETNIETMEPLQTVTGMDVLELGGSAIRDLAGIQKHTLLRKVDISHTAVTDLTPLRELPDLTELILSDDMDVDISVLSDMPGLTIVYQ